MPLHLDTTVPFGNACAVEIRDSAGLTTVRFAPDPHGGPEALWFCFRLKQQGTPARHPVKLVLTHFDNLLAGPQGSAVHPVARVAGGDWARLPAGTEEPLLDGRMLITWTIPAPERYVDLAFCYPYGEEELAQLLRDTGGYWRLDVIGSSQAALPLLRLSNDYGAPGGDRPGLYLIARQHAGETPGSWVLDGLLRRCAALGDAAPLVWAVPLADIDGIAQGDYGKDRPPYDLNRAWGQPPMRHEALVYQRDLFRWRERCRPALALDFHAPGGTETDGIYRFGPKAEAYPEMQPALAQWTAVLARALAPDFAAPNFARVITYPSRWTTPTFDQFCAGSLGLCAMGLETPYARMGERVLTRADYQRAGARMAEEIIKEFAPLMAK